MHWSNRAWKMEEDTCFKYWPLGSLWLESLLCPVTAEPSSVLHVPTATLCQHWPCLSGSLGCAIFSSHVLGSHSPWGGYCPQSPLTTNSTRWRTHRSLPREHELWDYFIHHDILSIILDECWKGTHNTWAVASCSSPHFFCIREWLFVSLYLPRILLSIYSVMQYCLLYLMSKTLISKAVPSCISFFFLNRIGLRKVGLYFAYIWIWRGIL